MYSVIQLCMNLYKMEYMYIHIFLTYHIADLTELTWYIFLIKSTQVTEEQEPLSSPFNFYKRILTMMSYLMF